MHDLMETVVYAHDDVDDFIGKLIIALMLVVGALTLFTIWRRKYRLSVRVNGG